MCKCPLSYTGVLCETYIDLCATSRCFAGSTCRVLPSSLQYICLCPYGYRGIYCDQKIPACESNPCINGNKKKYK